MIKSQEPGPTGVRIKADCPLSEMFGYIGDLRTMTSGRGQFSMEFSHYAPNEKRRLPAPFFCRSERLGGEAFHYGDEGVQLLKSGIQIGRDAQPLHSRPIDPYGEDAVLFKKGFRQISGIPPL